MTSPPKISSGTRSEDELKLPPKPIAWPQPSPSPTHKTVRDKKRSSRVSNKAGSLGSALGSMSIATKPPQRNADGAIRPVIQSIRNRAASSGQFNASFRTYRKKTCSRITITMSARATQAKLRPMRSRIVLMAIRRRKGAISDLMIVLQCL